MSHDTALAAAIAIAAGSLMGCQSYRSQPLDLPAHQDDFLSRTLDDPETAEQVRSAASASASDVPGFDLTDGISLSEAELVALVFNAELRVDRLRAGVTLAGAANAGLWEDPTIGVDLTRILDGTPHPWKVFTSIGVTIPISGRLDIEKQRAGLEHAAEIARVALNEWRLRMELRRAWSQWEAVEAQHAATAEFRQRVDQVMAIVDTMEQAGEVARTEARLLRMERASAAADHVMLQSQQAQSELMIKQLMGLSPTAPIQLIASRPGMSRFAADSGALVESSESSLPLTSPLLMVSAAEYEVAERTLELEIRKQYPDLHIGPGYGREDGEDQVLLGLSLPLPILNANRRGIAEATAARDVARASAQSELERLIAELAIARVQLQAAVTLRGTLENEITPLVDAQYDDARALARLGEVNTLVLLESLKRQHWARTRLIEAARDERLAEIQMEEIVGPMAPEGAAP